MEDRRRKTTVRSQSGLLGLLGFHGFLLLHGFRGLNGVLVGTEEAIAPGEVLTVVVLEIAMVNVVVSSTVDELPISEGNAIVNRGGPDGDGNEQDEMSQLVHGDDVRTEPIRPRLCPRIQGVEGKSGEGRWEDERVMQFVDRAVQQIAVERIMDPINAKIRNEEKEEDREHPIRSRQCQIIEIIKLQIDFSKTLFQRVVDRRINERNHENCFQGRPELTLDLAYVRPK